MTSEFLLRIRKCIHFLVLPVFFLTLNQLFFALILQWGNEKLQVLSLVHQTMHAVNDMYYFHCYNLRLRPQCLRFCLVQSFSTKPYSLKE